MARKKVASNRGTHSASMEAEDSALQLGALTASRDRVPPSASDASENTAPSSSKSSASSPAKNMGPAPDKITAPSPPKKPESSPAKSTASNSSKSTAPAVAKNPVPASSIEDEEAVPPASAKNTASASAKSEAPAPARNTASASAKSKAPATSSEDGMAAPPQDAKLRRLINNPARESDLHLVAGTPRGLPDLGARQRRRQHFRALHSFSFSHEAEGLTEGFADQEKRKEQKNQMYLEETKNTEQKASPQLPKERRCQNHAYMYGKDAVHRGGNDRDD